MRAFLLFLCITLSAHAQITALSGTYLGDGERNFYGNHAPSSLNVVWKIPLGSGKTNLAGKSITWSGSGWTGQPLVVRENGELFLIHGSLDHHMRKIRAATGEVVWQVNFGDAIKGTPTFADLGGDDLETRHVLICGSRRGAEADFEKDPAYSLRAISYQDGRELWRLNSIHTHCNSRDVDGSALVVGGKVMVPLENGYFSVLSAFPKDAVKEGGYFTPKIYKQSRIYEEKDLPLYQSELSCESSPTLLGGKAYVASGCGRVYACSKNWPWTGWQLDIGGDLDSSMPVTNDRCLLLGIEKEFIPGLGGVMKIKPGGGVMWYLPVGDVEFYEWHGGLVGTPAVNHRTAQSVSPDLACAVGVDGKLILFNHRKLQPGRKVPGPRQDQMFPTPLILDTAQLPSGSISTPLFIDDRIIVGHDKGMELYQVTPELKLQHLSSFTGPMFDSTPVVWDGHVYAGSKDGFLYCLGEQKVAAR